MKVSFNAILDNFKGEPLLNPDKSPVMLTTIVTSALLNQGPNDKTSGEEKAKRWLLATRIARAGEEPTEVTVEDVALIKRLIGEQYGPVVVGPAFVLLESAVSPTN